jgi:hypothetical protein
VPGPHYNERFRELLACIRLLDECEGTLNAANARVDALRNVLHVCNLAIKRVATGSMPSGSTRSVKRAAAG